MDKFYSLQSPFFQGNRLVKKLSGHSGCEILLFKNEKHLFVRKISSSVSYNDRLKKQCIKQKRTKLAFVHTPQIYGQGFLNDKFYFDMEYLNCRTLAESISSLEVEDIQKYIEMLFNSLSFSATRSVAGVQQIFSLKLQALVKQISTPSKEVKIALKWLEKKDFSSIQYSSCHGDLTLENILIDENKSLYLIDFLDSFYNSWLFDIAKLLQDLDVKWSFRQQKADANRDIRLCLAKEKLLDQLRRMPNSSMLLKDIYALLLMNLLRIFPYTKDADTLCFLNRAIASTIHTLQREQI